MTEVTNPLMENVERLEDGKLYLMGNRALLCLNLASELNQCLDGNSLLEDFKEITDKSLLCNQEIQIESHIKLHLWNSRCMTVFFYVTVKLYTICSSARKC